MSKVLISVLRWRESEEILMDTLCACRLEARTIPNTCVLLLMNEDNLSLSREVNSLAGIYYSSYTNQGPSLRNKALDYAAENDFTHVLFLDADIEPVPGSLPYLLSLLSGRPDLYCAGPQPFSCTPDIHLADSFVPLNDNQGLVCGWEGCGLTQYGLWDMQKVGNTRFPPLGPGWGWEDNWIHCEMLLKGYTNLAIYGLTYLHRSLNSSWKHLKKAGFDLPADAHRRKQAMIDHFSQFSGQNQELDTWLDHWRKWEMAPDAIARWEAL